MGYNYREVKCPYCDHKFMWNKDEYGDNIHLYKLKETGEYLGKAVCPMCNIGMLVIEHELVGIDTDDDRVETVGIRVI